MKLVGLSALALTAFLSATTGARASRRALVNNSGIIPGTNITVYGLIDLKSGKPVDYEEFASGFIHAPTTDNPDMVAKKILSKRGGEFDNKEFVRKYCIPQVSVNPEANPYHRSLTGRNDVNYFKGVGQGIPFPKSGTNCGLSAQDCPIALTQDITYTNAIAFTVSDSDSNSLTGTLGGSETITNSSSTAETVAHTLEKNWSHTNSHTEDYSLATTTGEIITAGNSSSSNDVKIRTDGKDWGKGSNENQEDGTNKNSEKHWNVELDVPFVKAGGGGSESNGETHSKSKGSNSHDNSNYQDGWNNGTTKEDNWSKQTQNLRTETRGSSDTSSDTTGGSDSTTNSVMKTKGIDISVGKDWSKSNSTTKEHGVTQGNTTTTASTTGITRTFYVPAGKCMALACFPRAEMLVLPYICVDTEEQTAERVAVSIAKYATQKQELECAFAGLILCQDDIQGTVPFVTVDDTYLSIGAKNVLRMGGAIDAGNPLISNNGDFMAIVEANGNFIVYRTGNIKVWETGPTPFVSIPNISTYKHRVRINSRGHLVVETMNMFSKVNPKYQTNIFRQVWSTQPVASNFTVGTPRRPDSPYDDYVLVLDDKGRLNLYDAMYIKTWCTYDTVGNNCGNNKGYKYQEHYLVPTDFPTPDPGLGPVRDPHNSIIHATSYLPGDSFVSKDANCTDGIPSGSGLQSPNGRFKVILYPTGNMVIKDGLRTMWTTNTANMERTTGPFKMFLNDAGDLVIADATKRWIWLGENKVSRTTGPFKATITDAGKFVVTDSLGKDVWESWPQNNISPAYMFMATARYCYDKCGECAATVNVTTAVTNTITAAPVTVTTTVTTATTTRPVATPTPNPESILNKCKAWMDTYKIDPFVNWGTIDKNPSMQAQWIYYDCACFGTYLKHGVEILRTHLGKWGKLTNASVRRQYTESYCNCPLAQDVFKITPNPKNWGSLKDTTLQSQWTKETCDDNVNREPFVTGAIGKGTPTWTTLANFTTNIQDNYFTTFTNTTGTTIGVNVTTGADSKTTSAIITTHLTNATMTVTDSKTIAITTGYTITTVPTGPSRTATTVVATPTPRCTGGTPGLGSHTDEDVQRCASFSINERFDLYDERFGSIKSTSKCTTCVAAINRTCQHCGTVHEPTGGAKNGIGCGACGKTTYTDYGITPTQSHVMKRKNGIQTLTPSKCRQILGQSKYIISHILVPPTGIRPPENVEWPSDISRAYTRIVEAVKVPGSNSHKSINQLYNSIVGYIRKDGVIKALSSKSGIFRTLMLVANGLRISEMVWNGNVDRMKEHASSGELWWQSEDTPALSDHVILGKSYDRALRNGDVVMFCRQPTLTKYSLLAFRVRTGRNIQQDVFAMNPAVTPSFNADYDGDEMNIYAGYGLEARAELMEFCHVTRNIYDPITDKVHVHPIQDVVSAVYMMTRWVKDISTELYQESCMIVGKYNKVPNPTTLDLLSLVFPNGLTFKSGEVCIKDGTIGKGKTYGHQALAIFIRDVQKVSLLWLDTHGITLGINQCKWDEVDIMEYSSNPSMDWALSKSMAKYHTDDSTNPLSIMLRSGAKGSCSRGFVRSGYLQGMDPKEYFYQASAAMSGIVDIGTSVSDVGYANRRVSKLTADVVLGYNGTKATKSQIVQFD
ncbi:hypothetical protein BGZ82_011604 [Podila clonocystis]|nr:hypothetical protein BGZ82_011604 [Podila clonocystis]